MSRDPVHSALLSILVAGVVLVGVLLYFFGKRSWFRLGDDEERQPAPCANDFACAARTAKKLETAAPGGELQVFATALAAAYERGDCALATELVEGAGRVLGADSRVADARRAVALAHLGACGDRREMPPAPPIDATITLERVKCSTACPAYVVSLRADGKLEWDGKANVSTVGKREAAVERTSTRELFDLFERVRFTKLDGEYLSASRDPELVRITLHRGNARHSVLTDAPCRTPASIAAGLCYLSARTDELMGIRRFAGEPRP